MGVKGGVAQVLGDPFLQVLADHVLQPFRLLVDLLPAVAQGLVEVGLEEAVVAQDLEGHLPPPLREPGPPVGLVLQEAKGLELLQHLRHGGRLDRESLRQGLRGDGPPEGLLQKKEVL